MEFITGIQKSCLENKKKDLLIEEAKILEQIKPLEEKLEIIKKQIYELDKKDVSRKPKWIYIPVILVGAYNDDDEAFEILDRHKEIQLSMQDIQQQENTADAIRLIENTLNQFDLDSNDELHLGFNFFVDKSCLTCLKNSYIQIYDFMFNYVLMDLHLNGDILLGSYIVNYREFIKKINELGLSSDKFPDEYEEFLNNNVTQNTDVAHQIYSAEQIMSSHKLTKKKIK